MSPTERITALTTEQKSRLDEFVDRWTHIALSTDPADRPRAEAAIRETYRQGGLEPPKAIVWCGSPLSLGPIGAIIRDEAASWRNARRGMIAKIESPLKGLNEPRRRRAKRDTEKPPAP
jgi:hypothetical protein